MLLRRKKYGANPVNEKGSIFAFFPFISRSRSESVIYFTKEIDLVAIEDYIAENKKNGINLSVFSLIVCAISKTFSKRPLLNRFILGKRVYQRDEFSISYVIKKNMTDNGRELIANMTISPRMTPSMVQDKMKKIQDELRLSKETGLDRLMSFFSSFPRFLLNAVFFILRRLDYHGLVPAYIRRELPFYSCVCISNLGSLGINPPFHHLYELGTTSFFIAMGKPEIRLYKNPVTNEILEKKVLPLNITADERICDGFYLARSMEKFIRYAVNPKTMES